MSFSLNTRWSDGIDVPAEYVNELLVKVTPTADTSPEMVLLLFGRVEPPTIVGTPEAQKKALEGIKELPIEVITKVAISPGRLRRFGEIMVGLADQFEAKRP